MKHARPDYNRIQDPSGKIPDDEPVFLLRAQDMLAPSLVRAWALNAKACGVHHTLVKMADDHAEAMLEWQRKKGRKLPDLPDAPGLDSGAELKEALEANAKEKLK